MEFVEENLHLKILEMLESNSENKAKEEAVKAGYLKTDEEFLKQVVIATSKLVFLSLRIRVSGLRITVMRIAGIG